MSIGISFISNKAMDAKDEYRKEIVDAYNQGKPILKSDRSNPEQWIRDNEPTWNWNFYNYKVDTVILPNPMLCTISRQEKIENSQAFITYCYDKHTLVMYMLVHSGGHYASITPMYNADGTLRLWKNENRFLQ